MSRITQTFERLKQENRVALIGYITAGDPDFEQSFEIISAACDAGLDVLELGIPFSDPTADGPVIQRASQRAIQSGMTLEKGLHFVRRLREKHDLPIIMFSYYNPIIAMGAERFVTEAIGAGADGVLVVDLPGENANELLQFVGPGRNLHFIRLISPTTDPVRRSEILRGADGFVYCVSRRGVTGANTGDSTIDWTELAQEMAAMRTETPVPLCVGFGISTVDDVRAIAKIADGAIIGSAFQQIIEEDPKTAKTKIGAMIRGFRGL
jgi:tryptophan synthase alpha chain